MGLDLTGILPKEIFHLLFIQMLEFQDNPLYSTSKACMYVKSWINEDVFKVRTPILPNQLQIGTDVTEQQILEIFKAQERVSIELREKFLNIGWRYFLLIQENGEMVKKEGVLQIILQVEKKKFLLRHHKEIQI